MPNWAEPAIPRVAVQILCIDYEHRLLLLHRGPNLRSARNVWSTPVGLLEIGERIHEGAARELKEECGLMAKRAEFIGCYENVNGDLDSEIAYHWVICLVSCLVADVTLAENLEPDKHDAIKAVDMYSLRSESFFSEYKFHDSLRDHVKYFHRNIIKSLERMLQ